MKFLLALFLVIPINAHAFMIVSQVGGSNLRTDDVNVEPGDAFPSPLDESSDAREQDDEVIDPDVKDAE